MDIKWNTNMHNCKGDYKVVILKEPYILNYHEGSHFQTPEKKKFV